MHGKDFLFDLLDTPSPTGFETRGQRVWMDYVSPHADRVETDAYGTAFATLEAPREGAPVLMLDAHVDEIGFMIKHVSDDGLLYVDRVGGSDAAVVRAQRVRFFGDKEEVVGVFSATAIHLRENRDDEKVPKWHEVWVDIGATSKEEVAERGLRIGHVGVFDVSPQHLTERRITARALDNRLGGFIMARVMENLAAEGERPGWTVVATNSVQEEIGLRGAQMIAYRVRPDAAVAFDVTHATDTPGLDGPKHGQVKMGEGPTITHGTSAHPAVVKKLMQAAEAEGVTFQHESSSRRTGTDADSIYTTRGGIPTALVSCPLRYMHTPAELVDLDDVEATIRVLTAFARSLKAAERFTAGL